MQAKAELNFAVAAAREPLPRTRAGESRSWAPELLPMSNESCSSPSDRVLLAARIKREIINQQPSDMLLALERQLLVEQ